MNLALSAIPGFAQIKGAWVAGKAWFYVGAAVAILLLGVYIGHHWASVGKVKAEAETQKVAADRDAWKDASKGWEFAAGRWQFRFEADEAAAAARAKEADRILETLRKDKAKADEAARKWAQEHGRTLTSPDCLALAKLVKESKCAAFSRY